VKDYSHSLERFEMIRKLQSSTYSNWCSNSNLSIITTADSYNGFGYLA